MYLLNAINLDTIIVFFPYNMKTHSPAHKKMTRYTEPHALDYLISTTWWEVTLKLCTVFPLQIPFR